MINNYIDNSIFENYPNKNQFMKRSFAIVAILLSSILYAQKPRFGDSNQKKSAFTIGILQGGGSLVGADLEFLVNERFGLQVGAGLVGFGCGINYHFRPSIRSSFITLQYWNQGVRSSFTQNLIGPAYVYRGKRWLTFQLGLATALQKGPNWPDGLEQPDIQLTYAIGAYFPW